MRSVAGRGAAELLSYGEVFERYVDLDPHTAGIDVLMAAAPTGSKGDRPIFADTKIGTVPSPPPASLAKEDRDGWLDWLLTEQVQARLGVERPVLLYDFPASQAALAQVRPGLPAVAERFELYVDGWELANGYHELLDAGELRRRNARQTNSTAPTASRRCRKRVVSWPQWSMVFRQRSAALGFDRLVMLAAGAKSIEEVIAFPWERA